MPRILHRASLRTFNYLRTRRGACGSLQSVADYVFPQRLAEEFAGELGRDGDGFPMPQFLTHLFEGNPKWGGDDDSHSLKIMFC